MRASLTFRQRHLDAIVAHAKREAPNECCGIFAGTEAGLVTHVFEMTNARASPTEFFMDPQEQFEVLDEMRAARLEMVGVYHSHPSTPARPSARDVKMAFYPDVAQVIVSLAGNEPTVRAFLITDGTATALPLRTENGAAKD